MTNTQLDEEREQQLANEVYDRYLQRRGITAGEHEREIGKWIDAQD